MNWPLVEIGKHVEKVETWNPVTSGVEKEFRYIDLSSVDKDKKLIDLDSVSEVSPAGAPSRARQLVHSRDVLVATVRPNLNGVALVPIELQGATASTGYCVLRTDENRLHDKYLFYWVQSRSFVEEMISKATGANYPAVSDRIIKESQIPLPPLPEQKRIAAILDKADAIRGKRQQAIQLADDFLRAVFLDMFGDPVTNPKGWGTLSLGSLVKKPITYGILKPEEYVENGIPMLRIQDLKGGVIDEDDSFHLVTERLSSQYKRTILEGGEIVISLVGTVGLVATVPSSLSGANVHRNLGVISLRDSELSEYLCSLMQLPDFMVILDRITKGGVHRLLNLADLKEVGIPIPDIGLVRNFTKLKGSVRSMCVLSKLFSDELMFESLSQKAFSGQL